MYKHDAIVRAWLDGKQIQVRDKPSELWRDYPEIDSGVVPAFPPRREFRIKPEPKKTLGKGNMRKFMNKPHKHAELIKAWSDGAEIQFFDKDWKNCVGNPNWSEYVEYRIKPTPILCRLYKRRGSSTLIHSVTDQERGRFNILNSDPAVEWVTPWFNPEDIKEST